MYSGIRNGACLTGINRLILTTLLTVIGVGTSFAQCTFGAPACTSSIPNNNSRNFNALVWAGGTCPTGSAYTGNLLLDMGANSDLVITANYTITGDFNITTSGATPTITIPVGVTFHVTGNLGDCDNNNTAFVVNGTLVVDGYISGKNNNAFSGTGSVTAGGLYFNNNTTCPSCSITWDVGVCVAGPAFCALPIHLLSFDAVAKANGVHLKWVTESEQNFDFFTLEKSSNGKHFYSVADLPGHGNSSERQTYGFLDEHPLIGKSYYRLKETNLDGSVIHHRIISIEYSGGRLLDLYPVPVTNGVLNLRTNFQSGLDAQVIIKDISGRALQAATLRGSVMAVPLNLEPGIYLLTFISGEFRTVKRFIVR